MHIPANRDVLDEQTRDMIALIEADPFLDPETMTPAEMREAFDRFYARLGFPELEIDRAEDIRIPGPGGSLAARSYYPAGASEGLKPVLVFFHGGGMMMGSLNAYDGLCRRLAHRSGCIVVSATYRLAPEHKFPAAVEDALATVRWVHDHATRLGADASRLAVGGESGGGNLAAVVAQQLRGAGDPRIVFQLLINPAVGTSRQSNSMKRYARGFFFEPEALDWFYSQYLNEPGERTDVRASPALATDLSDLAPAFIAIAGCDILRDDIEDYARRLEGAGVPVEARVYERTIHGFTVMGAKIDAGVRAIDDCGSALRRALGA